MKETLREYVDSRGVTMRVERQNGIIRGVKILGLESRNGRRYPIETLTHAVGLYEGAKVNVNHSPGGPNGPRDYRDRLGSIRNVRLRPAEGLFADLFFNPKHALAEQLIWDAEHAAENVGFSHNVLAMTSRSGDHVQVEQITKVESVDLVADPATTQGLFEAVDLIAKGDDLQSPDGADAACHATTANADDKQNDFREEAFWTGLDADTLRRKRPGLVEELLRESRDELDALRHELEQLQNSVLAQKRQQLINELLSEFELPPSQGEGEYAMVVVDQQFMQSLREAEDERTVRSLIEGRAKLVRAVRRGLAEANESVAGERGKPICRGQVGFASVDDTNSFVKAITRLSSD